ncbi:MAG TPA: aldo/keto reductase [Prolixibacteraceae bacterium]|jgi:diketogulonate reductase-like aldo/keto reductase|nr:aldo/keto reductase [Prolixibacteraceae bacterium]
MAFTSSVKLSNGVEMPILGLGVFKSHEGEEVERAVKYALQIGYRSIDTAAMYGNEHGVGSAIIQSGVPRQEIFLTTKIWNSDQGYQSTFRAFEESLEKLQTNYIDLYLIHWPKGELSLQTWKAMVELYQKGEIRAIGVSNFMTPHLKHLMENASGIQPMVNQVEFHPRLVQPELLKFCHDNHIQPEAWTPIMHGIVNDIPVLQALAVKYQKSPVQVVLRWDIQKGVVTIPKSVNPERILHNADIFDFELSEEDMSKIDHLDKSARIGADPNNFNF